MALAPFVWEQSLSSSLGITVSQQRFVLALFASIPLGSVQRLIKSPTGQHLYASIVGFFLVFLPFGSGCWHAIIPSLATYLCMKFCPQRSALVGWVITFPYLLVLHVANASGASWQEGQMDFTGAQMLLVLKLISVAHCCQDAHSGKVLNEYQKAKAIYRCPTLLELAAYLFCNGTLLAGPHFEFKDYMDYVHREGVWKHSIPFSIVSVLQPFVQGVMLMGAYVYLSPIYQFRVYNTAAFLNAGLLSRYGQNWILAITARMRYYFVWSIAEAGMNASGLGYSGVPEGKKNGEPNHEWMRGQNVRILRVEMADSFTLVATHWNIGTGNFLRRYVYDRLTPPGKKPAFTTLLMTQLVSGVWHGLYPGYWLFFITTAICVNTARVIHRQVRTFSPMIQNIMVVPKTLFTSITLAYAAASFEVLELRGCFNVWSNMYFIPHIICVVILVAGQLLPASKPKAKSQ
ncbi:hypothetical protein BSKO_00332 [Bryopsis sp. KO-2023]|nr:hypothetical protein BSKO_00332 [Bryopsis sp. KO-2023]